MSDNAALYFCGYPLYSLLAVIHKRNEFRRAEFLHVPAKRAEADTQRSTRVAVTLIVALIARKSIQEVFVGLNIYSGLAVLQERSHFASTVFSTRVIESLGAKRTSLTLSRESGTGWLILLLQHFDGPQRNLYQ